MSIQELAAVLPPPPQPRETTGDWAKVEAEVGTPLPADFKDYVARYGTGVVNEFLWPLNPFAANDNVNLLAEIRFQLETLRETRTKFPKKFTYAIFPEPGGYLPWGRSENGDVMHWKTEGMPDQWTVAVTDAREPVWEEFAVPMTTFLAQLLSGQITCGIFPPDFLEGGPRFTPKG
jgi:hypothetical protein